MKIVGLTVLLVVLGVASGCGSDADYGDDNAALADRLLLSTGVFEVVASGDSTYCSSGNCRNDDGVITTYQVRVVAALDDVVAAFYAAYPDFDIVADRCDSPATQCDGILNVSATQDRQSIYLSVNEYLDGTLSVDARSVDYTGPTAPANDEMPAS